MIEKTVQSQRRPKSANRIDVCPVTRWQRPCTGVVVCLSIDHGELLREHKGVEADGRKRRRRVQRGSTTQKLSVVRMEVDSEECHSVTETNLPIAKKGMQM
ncbi:hypothetical protein GW17_00044225 [Ensete ventricosum]|nr:hypothetical protein GW17_00044225 [Ensete ventricosum]RZR98002.1 hypothetical protein BHM03_00027289 [Ensete ventricosum]